ncbi:hypothetical protein KSF_002470 [Reticulibacter mediterranei]|uniref:Transposase IS701-like DDE domain-containing protein n=1 Tax=Reticulibacter mediterranei TaxID=2778369 RepID=A0A8J3IFD4_9CHLR|nr:transposase [Reticulibacter mediterranei]GHO90199.1 hypothetical protein KSF_002470 [Reticulibacter mediterranei]
MKKQYCGTTGTVENCQVGVFLSYVSAKGHTLLDRELYLPKEWIDDAECCREAVIPEVIAFRTKCELARQMIGTLVGSRDSLLGKRNKLDHSGAKAEELT